MPRRSSRSRASAVTKDALVEEDEQGEDMEQQEDEGINDNDEVTPSSRRRRTTDTTKRSTRSKRASQESKTIENDEELEDNNGNDDDDAEMGRQTFCSSQVQDLTQDILPAKENEKSNLARLSHEKREKALCDLARVVLFKAMSYEPISRVACIKEADIDHLKIGSAAFAEVQNRLQNVFGFELKRMPLWMDRVKGVPAKCKDRYYIINSIKDEEGEHMKEIHNVHSDAAIEKGLLMMILALAYCKGEPRNDGSRWILDKDLFYLLNLLDENIPAEPPVPGSKKKRIHTSQVSRQSDGGSGISQTPDVDVLLDKFERHDQIIVLKATDQQISQSQAVEPESFYYTMGPRAAAEIGRRQIIYFCAEILGEAPDQTMLDEVKADEKYARDDHEMEHVG